MKQKLLIAVLVAFAASGAIAQQKMFKSTMPDGKIIYGEKPEPGAKRVDPVDGPPKKSGVETLTQDEKDRAEFLRRKPAASAASANPALDEARQKLKQAEAAREAAKVEKEGDRIGTKGGYARLSDDFNARQKAAEAAVEAARKRVQELEPVQKIQR